MPKSALACLDALPQYLGSKRELARPIFTAMSEAGYGPGGGFVLCDAFAGGCSIALTGKRLGYRVMANDSSQRSEAVGKAFVENDSVQLTKEDVALALDQSIRDWWLPPVKDLPWPDGARELLAQIAKAAGTFENPAKAALMRSLMLKTATRLSMWGQVRSLGVSHARQGEWDAMTRTQIDRVPALTRPRRMMLLALAAMEQGVFPNGYANRMYRSDVLGMWDKLAEQPDVLYLDPPYPETETYERNYWALDGILANEAPPTDPSRFSRAGGWRHLADVFESAAHVPCWVVSVGGKGVEVEELAELMREGGKTVQTHAIRYGHITSKENEETKATSHEFILVAT
jgi:D12 class N6 adenine-specific DNA methyltransferase